MAYSDPERQRAYAREWLKRYPEKARAATKRWSQTHPEKKRAARRRYYVRNRERLKVLQSRWLAAHPEVRRAKESAYRARARAAEGRFTAAEWRALVETHNGGCAYCGASGHLEADHRTPLSRGGTNSIDNILPACRVCNSKKHTLTEEEFRARLAAERRLPPQPLE